MEQEIDSGLKHFVSVIMPVYNEEDFIEEAIRTLLEQGGWPQEKMEILVIDGGSTDETRAIVERLKQNFGNIRLLENPARITPVGLNLGIKNARGDVIMRADGHSTYSRNYVKILVQALDKLPGAWNVGGRFVHVPRKPTAWGRAISKVLSTKFGVGGAVYRTVSAEAQAMEVDTVPYGCWPRWVFERVGYFDERLVRNQDIEMNARIRRAGGKIYLLPHVEIYYRSAADLGALVRYMFRNGEWNILTFRLLKVRRFLSLRHFVPMFFVIGLIISLFLGFIKSIFFYVFVLIVLSYSVLAIFFSVRYGRRDWWRMFVGYWVLHLSYGFGELVGIVESLKRGDY